MALNDPPGSRPTRPEASPDPASADPASAGDVTGAGASKVPAVLEPRTTAMTAAIVVPNTLSAEVQPMQKMFVQFWGDDCGAVSPEWMLMAAARANRSMTKHLVE